MPAFLVLEAERRRAMAAKLRRLRTHNGLSIAASCKLAKVSVSWYYKHRDMIGV